MKRNALKQLQRQQQLTGNYEVVTNLSAINGTFEMEGNIAYGPIREYSIEENAAYISARNMTTENLWQ